MKKLATLIVVIAGLVVSGCGLRGDLERPPPSFGHDAITDRDA